LETEEADSWGENQMKDGMLLAVCLWGLLSGPAAMTQQTINVGPNVQVSQQHPNRQHSEVQLAAHPTNQDHLLGCAMISPSDPRENPNDHMTIVYVSFDGGRSWQSTLEIGPGVISRDPTCVFSPDGTALFAGFDFPAELQFTTGARGRFANFVYRSKDGGRTWLPRAVLPTVVDRPFLAVDHTQGERRGRVYLGGNAGAKRFDSQRSTTGLQMFYSTDGGVEFRLGRRLVGSEDNWALGDSNPVVLSNGTLVWAFGEMKEYWRPDGKGFIPDYTPKQPNASLKAIRSEDGGERFSDATVVSDWYLRFYGSVNSIPSLAVDQSNGMFKDRVYVAWTDCRSGRCEIFFSFSSDQGKTWSSPKAINDDEARPAPGEGPDNHMPVVAVNSAGVVGVMWYDRRDNPDNLGWWVRFSASLDGGETFLPSVRISEKPYSPEQMRPALLDWEGRQSGKAGDSSGGLILKTYIGLFAFTYMGGDTAGMAADAAGVFHPFWVDNRTGVAQLWTAPVRVDGKARLNGSPDLEKLSNITEHMKLSFGNARYDRESQTISAEVFLTNTSDRKLNAPIKVRVLAISSVAGLVEVVDTDNDLKQAGAVWDFTPFLEGGALAPGKETKPRTIRFRLHNPKPFRPLPETRYAVSLVTLETRILGNIETAREKRQ